ncbi:MAG: sodium-dependent transporter, partial [Nitrospinae bacterium]|nr:sodium-dependent transporter [Nitrospinota bacterium]
MNSNVKVRGFWTSRWGFILAASGSAVGLGNIWKFPYITGQNGGGAFVLVYLICILIIGIPVMMGELLIGRRGRQSPSHSISHLAKEAGAPQVWTAMGFMGISASFLILTFYVVIAGWAIAYIVTTATGTFRGATAEEVGATFDTFLASPLQLIFWSTLVTVGTMVTVAGGVRKGLERAVTWLMPGMLVILLILVGYAMSTGSFIEGFNFLFKPDFTKLSPSAVLVALGHAFFTLSLASGVMIAYGAYLPDDTSIFQTSVIVAAADTAVALIAGLAIFPIVFAYGLDVGKGPGLIFTTLPIAFGQMPFGTFFGTLFFIMLSLAAFTSAISLLEPTVAWIVERFSVS